MTSTMMRMSQRRVGLLGGTFDPPHIGHLVVAVEARATLNLDEVWLLVAHTPWQKSSRGVTDAEHRLAMARAAVVGLDGLVASDFEFDPPGPTYTVDTLERLVRVRPEVMPTLILGADAAAGVDTWHRSADVASLADIAVVDRPGCGSTTPATLAVPQLDVSSTGIRARVQTGRPIDVLCPPGVVSLISELGLYDGGDGS